MTTNAPPSINPANWDTLTGVFRHIMSKTLQRFDSAMPATVITYDRSANPPIAVVQPSINMVTTDNDIVQRATVSAVVARIGNAAGFIDFPLQAGDEGVLFACDRDISLFLQNGGTVKPNTMRVKSFSDSFFLPVLLRGAVIAGEDLAYPVFQNAAGTVKIVLKEDQVYIETQTMVKVKTPTFAVDGDIIASGNITPNVPMP